MKIVWKTNENALKPIRNNKFTEKLMEINTTEGTPMKTNRKLMEANENPWKTNENHRI